MRKLAISGISVRLLGALVLLSSTLATNLSSTLATNYHLPTAAGQATAQDDIVRVNTDLVTVPVSVLDRHGKFIPYLKQEQFHLYEDSVEQNISYFESVETAFTVALLLDTSDSTELKLKDIQAAAIAFLNQLRPEDHLLVFAFDSGVEEFASAPGDKSQLGEAIKRIQSGGGTSLYDTLDLVVRRRLAGIRGRKAIVLFSDGVDTTSRVASYESTLRAAEELDALIYAIRYDTYDDEIRNPPTGNMTARVATPKGEPLSVAYERASRYLHLITAKTGGRFFQANRLARLTESFELISAELRQKYIIGYYPTNRAPEQRSRKLKVQVSVPNVKVRARKSYIYSAKS